MAKADGGKHLETLAQQLISASTQPKRTQSVTVGGVHQLWRTNPTPPQDPEMVDDCLVYLTGPSSEEELDRIECKIECQEPGSSTWRDITDPNGWGTTFAPFNGAYVYDEVTMPGIHKYRAYAKYPNPANPSQPIVITSAPPHPEVDAENCEGMNASKSAKKPASKQPRAKS